MRKLLISVAVASAAVIAMPAAAQGAYGGQGYSQRGQHGYPGDRGLMQRFNQQISQLEQRIERSAQRRAISPGEYRALRQHAANLRQRLNRFARNGLSRGEVQDISARIDNLRDRIRDERRDGRDGRRGW
jgi:flagellar biosynthesis chaperone FliJ